MNFYFDFQSIYIGWTKKSLTESDVMKRKIYLKVLKEDIWGVANKNVNKKCIESFNN